MRPKTDRTRFHLYLLAPVSVILSLTLSCASNPPESAEEIVGNRALLWGELLMSQRYEDALQLTTPAFRNSPRAAGYQSDYAGATFWQNLELKQVACEPPEEPDVCEVRLIVTFQNKPAIPWPMPIPLDTSWMYIDGQWFVYHD